MFDTQISYTSPFDQSKLKSFYSKFADYPSGYYYVKKIENSTTIIYCGVDKEIAQRLEEILDEVYWYENVTPCHTCAPVDYKELANKKMKCASEFALHSGFTLHSYTDTHVTKLLE